MDTFEENITSIYREKGRKWLAELPKQVQQFTALWGLSHLRPCDHLSLNYVLSGYQGDNPVILKLSPDAVSVQKEAIALAAFAGYGAVAVLDHQDHALLLQRAVPGNRLKGSPKAIEIACDVMKKLHTAPLQKGGNFPHIQDWLSILDKKWDNIPEELLGKARKLRDDLLKNSTTTPVLLHGDLHQDNILSDGKEWVVIDPKGVIGDPIHELWALVEEPNYDLRYISNYFNFHFDDVVKWYYVRLILAACWRVEDHLDPKLFLDLARIALECSRHTRT